MIFNSPWPLNAPKLVIYEPHILAMAMRYVAIYKISNVIGEGREWAILYIINISSSLQVIILTLLHPYNGFTISLVC